MCGTILLRDFEIVLNALHLFGSGDRAHNGIGLRADFAALCRFDHASNDIVIDSALNQQACARSANLPGIGRKSGEGRGYEVVQIGVFEHDIGGFSAQLQCQRDNPFDRDFTNFASGAHAADETDFAHLRMGHQRRAALQPCGQDNI